MPRKNIYIRKQDGAIFDRAQRIADAMDMSLSEVIARSLDAHLNSVEWDGAMVKLEGDLMRMRRKIREAVEQGRDPWSLTGAELDS